MSLKTETNTEEMRQRVLAAACVGLQSHDGLYTVHFEHGQWWVICTPCGAAWSVVDAEGGNSVDGFDFERVSEGDGYCEEQHDAQD